MITGKYLWNGDDLKDAYDIRRRVFIDELGREEINVFDNFDKISVHGIIYNEEKKAVASGRIFYDGEIYRIEKIAVLIEERNKGYGEFLVKMLIDKGFEAGASDINVRTQERAKQFYQKIGFNNSGDMFTDTDNLYVQPMKLKKEDLCKKCRHKNPSAAR